jgi:hypothetical protein
VRTSACVGPLKRTAGFRSALHMRVTIQLSIAGGKPRTLQHNSQWPYTCTEYLSRRHVLIDKLRGINETTTMKKTPLPPHRTNSDSRIFSSHRSTEVTYDALHTHLSSVARHPRLIGLCKGGAYAKPSTYSAAGTRGGPTGVVAVCAKIL